MSNVVYLPFDPEVIGRQTLDRLFEAPNGSRISIVHTADGRISMEVANPFGSVVVLMNPTTARDIADVLKDEADTAEFAPVADPQGAA